MDIYRIINGLVDNSTSESLNAPDMNAMREVSEIVRSRADMPKEVVKLINNKLMKRDKKVTLLCLELLEYLTYTCEITLYNQIATKDFLLKMGTLLKSHDLGELVISRACRLIKCWRDLFNKDLHTFFFQFYENVVKKGIEIPSNYVSPYANLKGSVHQSSTSNNSSANNSFKPAVSNQKQPLPTSGPKAKLRSDLELTKQNITLVNDMIDNQDPRGNVEQNDSLNDLIPALKKQETQMMALIEKLAGENDESLLEMCLQLNDDLQSTLERYQSLKRHMKPKPFRGKAVEDHVLQQIQNLEISSASQQTSASNAFSPSIFQENAQELNQVVTKAQFKIPPPSGQQSFQPAAIQPPTTTTQVSKPIVAATNLLDLFDDDDVQPAVVAPIVQQQQPQQQQQQQPLYQSVQQTVQPTGLVYGQSQQVQQPPQQPPQNNYAALNALGGMPQQQQQMPMGYAQYNTMGGGYNTQSMGGYGTGMPMQQMGYNTAQNYGMPQQPQGYGQPQVGGYGAPLQQQQQQQQPPLGGYGGNTGSGYGGGYNNVQGGGYGTSSNNAGGYGGNTGGYGGGMPVTSTLPPVNKNGGYGTAIAKKDAFDDLDDMFGIGGGSNTTASTSNKSATTSITASSQNYGTQPKSNTIDFDLF